MSTSEIKEKLLAEEELIIPEVLTVAASAPVLTAASYAHTVTGKSGRNGGWKTFKEDVNAVDSYYFSNNRCKKDGGVILNKGSSTLTVSNSYFKNNYGGDKYGDTNGGAIKNDSILYVINTTFDSNYSNVCDRHYLRKRKASKVTPSKGGAVYNNEDAYASISGSDFKNNTAVQGGAIYNDETMSISNTSFYCNEAFEDTSRKTLTVRGVVRAIKSRHEDSGGNGGAINNGGYLSIDGATFDFNDANDDGGAIYNYYQGQLYVSNSTFTRNSAETGYGGAIYNQGAGTEFYLNNCLFQGNFSGLETFHTFASNGGYCTDDYSLTVGTLGYGGALYNAGDTITGLIRRQHIYGYTKNSVTVTGSTFTNNAVGGEGGAIYNTDGGGITITNSSFTGNGAGITKFVTIGVVVIDCGSYKIPIPYNNKNYTGGLGGAIANCYQGEIVVNGDTEYKDNTADRQGGAIYNNTEGDDGTHPTSFVQKLVQILSFGIDDIVNKAVDALVYNIIYEDEPVSVVVHNDAATFTNNVVWYDESRVKNSIRYGWDCVGGAISNVTSGYMEFKGALTVTNNVSEDYGGGIYQASNASMLIESTADFTSNSTGRAGGAIYNDGGNISFTGGSVTFTGNKVDANYVDTRFSIRVKDRTKINHGGAIYNLDGIMRFDEAVTFTQNVVSPVNSTDDTYGGAISNGSILTFNDVVHFSGNTAKKGGAIYNFVNNSSILPRLYDSVKEVQEEVQKRIGTVTISNKMYLDTDSDTIYNDTSACLIWDLYWDGSFGYLSDYSKLTNNNGKLKIAVNSKELKGISSYILADNAGGDLTGKNTFTLYMHPDEDGVATTTETAEITVGGGAVTYNGYEYTLSIKNNTQLVLSVGGTPERIVVNNVNFKRTDGYFDPAGLSFSNVHSTGVNGGAIAVESTGTFVADNCTFSNNSAQTVQSGGALAHFYTSGADRGGISTITNSTFSNNTAYNGGAMVNVTKAVLSLTNVTVTNNYARNAGGAIYGEGGTTSLVNVTFSSNTSGRDGGAVYNAGILNLSDVTFSGNQGRNGGAVYNTNVINLQGTVTLSGASDTIYGGTLNWNVLNQTSCGYISDWSKLQNISSFVISGSSSTQYGRYKLAGNAASANGTLFTIHNASDTEIISLTVNGDSVVYGDVFRANLAVKDNDLYLTIIPDDDHIVVSASEGAFVGKGGTFTMPDGLILDAKELERKTYSGNGGILYVKNDGYLYSGGTSSFSGFAVTGYGGAIYNEGTVDISNVTFTGNTASVSGGAISNHGGSLTVTDSLFTGNRAWNAGCIYNDGAGTVTLKNVTFADNGGLQTPVMYNAAGTVYFDNVTLSHNTPSTSMFEKASLFNNSNFRLSGSLTIDVTGTDVICNNGNLYWEVHADGTNGYLSNYSRISAKGSLCISVDADTQAGRYLLAGDASAAAGQSFTVQESGSQTTITVNGDVVTLGHKKYKLWTDDSNNLMLSVFCRIVVNETNFPTKGVCTLNDIGIDYNLPAYDGYGGVIEVQSDGTLYNSDDIIFCGNTVSETGGAIYSTGTMDLKVVQFNNNYASTAGGAIYNCGSGTLTRCTFSGNTSGQGGAISGGSSDQNLTLTGCIFENNTASDAGGAITVDGTVTLQDSAVFDGNISVGHPESGAINILNNAQLNLAGQVYLETSTDTIKNYGSMNWDLTGKVTGWLNNYSLLSNSNRLYITVKPQVDDPEDPASDENMAPGSEYVLASGVTDLDGKSLFYITGNPDCADTGIYVNSGWAVYDGVGYRLSTREVTDDVEGTHTDLILHVSNDRIIVNKTNYPDDGVYTVDSDDYFAVYETYTGADGGGAMVVESDGTLTGSGATFYYNTATVGGALANYGIVNISDVTFNNNSSNSKDDANLSGGAFYNRGTAVLDHVTFSLNDASQGRYGGAIASRNGSLTITNSKFSNNIANSSGGYGGAIYAEGGSGVVFSNVSFTGNQAKWSGGAVVLSNLSSESVITDTSFVNNSTSKENAGAMYICNSPTTLRNVTFTGNSTLYNGGAIKVENSILTLDQVTFSGNTAQAKTGGGAIHCFNSNVKFAGDVTLATAKDTIHCQYGFNFTWVLENTSHYGKLNEWRFTTAGYNLTKDNMFISVSDDQEAGNYILVEHGAPSTAAFTLNGIDGAGTVTITTGGDTVRYGKNDYTLTLTDNQLVLNVTPYTGPDIKQIVVPENESAAIDNSRYYTVNLDSEKYDGYKDYGAIVVCSGGTLTGTGTQAQQIVVTGNTLSTSQPGAALNNSGETTLNYVEFSNNRSSENGGAISNHDSSKLTIDHGSFANNFDSGWGGVIYNDAGTVSISNSDITGNSCSCQGGVICNSNGTGTITDTVITGNYAESDGGVICNDAIGDLTLNNVEFTGNTCVCYGGVIQNSNYSTITASNTTFSSNSAWKGGAIYQNNNSKVTLADVTFTGNTATAGNGGAVYNNSTCTINIEGTVTLGTETDTIVNDGTINWNLAAGTQTKTDFSISDWSLVSGSGNYTVTVDDWDTQVGGIYTLAENVTGDFSVTVKNTDGTEITSMTVNQSATNSVYKSGNGVLYELNLDENKEVTFTVARGIFLNNTWVSGQEVKATFRGYEFTGYVGDGTFFCDPEAAKTECDNRQGIIVAAGEADYSVHCDGHNTHIESGTAQKMLFGGSIYREAAVEEQNNEPVLLAASSDNIENEEQSGYLISVKEGNYMNSAAAGDAVLVNTNVTRVSDLDVLITGGTFSKRVAGGMYYAGGTGGSAVLEGNINFVINGGTFNGRIYGGSNAKDQTFGTYTLISGDVNILVRAGENDIYINECLVAGSRGDGAIDGSTRVVFSGNGDKLHFGADSVVFGGSNSDFVKRQDSVVTISSSVAESRDLVFNAYTGDFGAELRLFQTATFKNNSTVNFTDSDLDMWTVEEWNFEYGSAITGLADNEFYGDTLNFDLGNWDGSGVWNVLSGSYDAISDFLQADAVYFGDSAAEMDSLGGCWSDGTYKLSATTDKLTNTAILSVSKTA